jgi:CO/xanthine dehydrogenase Mo-binding subunit
VPLWGLSPHRPALRPSGFLLLLQEPTIHFAGQPIALVLAETLGQARVAAAAVDVTYETSPAVTAIRQALDRAFAPKEAAGPVATDSRRGDPEHRLATAAVRIERRYTTPAHNHHPIEPHAVIAAWEGPDSFALESALDELAHELGLDPLELRLRNYADHDQHAGLPWSSNGLRECYRVAADRFGWTRRPSEIGALGQGIHRFGWGMASACYPVYRMASEAAVRIDKDGRVLVRCGTQDMGTGTYTCWPSWPGRRWACRSRG